MNFFVQVFERDQTDQKSEGKMLWEEIPLKFV